MEMKMRLYAVKDALGHPLYDVKAPSPEAACATVYEHLMRRAMDRRQAVSEVVDDMRPYENLVALEVE
jgi:hypothetical protein